YIAMAKMQDLAGELLKCPAVGSENRVISRTGTAPCTFRSVVKQIRGLHQNGTMAQNEIKHESSKAVFQNRCFCIGARMRPSPVRAAIDHEFACHKYGGKDAGD